MALAHLTEFFLFIFFCSHHLKMLDLLHLEEFNLEQTYTPLAQKMVHSGLPTSLDSVIKIATFNLGMIQDVVLLLSF